MTTSTLTSEAVASRFPPGHPSDRWFFPLLVALIWLGVLMGFVPEIAQHFARHEPAYPPILHLHGVVFGGWLVLLSAQVLLIRTGRWELHRRLGIAGALLAPVVATVGLATAYVMDRLEYGTAKADTPFLFVQSTDMLAFATLAGAGLLLRADGSAHKRLMLLATIYIADAGYSRWIGTIIDHAGLATPFWGYFVALYGGSDLLALGLGGYDMLTRRRLHPAYLAAMAWIAAIQLVSVHMKWDAGWGVTAAHLLGH
jgi:hypothetical protein